MEETEAGGFAYWADEQGSITIVGNDETIVITKNDITRMMAMSLNKAHHPDCPCQKKEVEK